MALGKAAVRDPEGTAKKLGESIAQPFVEGKAKLDAGKTFDGTAQITEAASDTILNAATGGGKALVKVLAGGLPGLPGIIKKVDLPDVPNFSKADFPEVGTKISRQTQQRHLTDGQLSGGKGTKSPDAGGELASLADAQKVLDAFHSGEATIVGKTARQGFPIVEFKGVTGTNVNVGSSFPSQPTNTFIIKGTKTVSIVPTTPTKAGK